MVLIPVYTAVEVSKIVFTHMKPNAVILVNKNEVFDGIAATPLVHLPINDSLLFTDGNMLSQETLSEICRLSPKGYQKMYEINAYIVGSTKTISEDVEKTISQLENVKHIDRIDGDTPYDIAVNFAKYKDSKTKFGWGRDYKEGHAFTFGELNHPVDTIAGVSFAHIGKHTPLLLTGNNIVPSVVEKYIKSVKPIPPKDMPRPPFMHGFILGNISYITYPTQVMIDQMLSIDYEMMSMD